MSRDQHDDELDALAGEYVLGSLDAERRAQVERRLPVDPALRAAVDAWEVRLLPLADLVEPIAPPPRLWGRIEQSLSWLEQRQAPPAPTPTSGWHRLRLWQGLSGFALAAVVVLASLIVLQPGHVTGQRPTYLVVLVAPQDKSAGWVVQTHDARNVDLIPLGAEDVPADKTLQFWTKADDWQGPVSLGLVKPGQALRVPMDTLPPIEADQLFELTLEQAGGSPVGRPTGPVKFIGRTVKVI